MKSGCQEKNPADAYTIDIRDVIFPALGAIAMGVFGFFILFKFLKWEIENIKENRSKGNKTIIAFKLPSKGEIIVGIILALIVALFIILQVKVLNGMIIGAVVFGFFFLLWVDVCLLK